MCVCVHAFVGIFKLVYICGRIYVMQECPVCEICMHTFLHGSFIHVFDVLVCINFIKLSVTVIFSRCSNGRVSKTRNYHCPSKSSSMQQCPIEFIKEIIKFINIYELEMQF